MPRIRPSVRKPEKTLGQQALALPAQALLLLNKPGEFAREQVFGSKFGEDITGGAISGTLLDLAFDPLNLFALGPLTKASKFKKLLRTAKFLEGERAIQDSVEVAQKLEKTLGKLGISRDQLQLITKAGADQPFFRNLETKLSGRKRFAQRPVGGGVVEQATPEGLLTKLRPDKPITELTTFDIPGTRKTPGLSGLASFEDLFLDKFKQAAGTPGARAIQVGKGVKQTDFEREAQARFTTLDTELQGLATSTGMTREEVNKAVPHIQEVVLGEANPENALNGLRQAWKKGKKMPAGKSKAGNDLIDQFAESLKLGQLDEGMLDEVVTTWVNQGGAARAMREDVGRKIKKSADDAIHTLERANQKLMTYPTELVKKAKDLDNLFDDQLAREVWAGLDVERLDSKTVNYFARRLSIEGRAALNSMDATRKKQVFNLIDGKLTTGAFGERSAKLKNMSTENANKVMAKHLGMKKSNFFTTDPAKAMFGRELATTELRAAALSEEALLKTFAAAGEGIPIEQILKERGLRKYGKAKWAHKATTKDIAAALEEEGLAGLKLNAEIAQQARLFSHVADPKHPASKKFLRTWDSIMSMYRKNVTVYFPAYHIRNALGNFINAGVFGGSASDVESWIRGSKLAFERFSGKTMGRAASKEYDRLLRLGVAGRGLTYETRALANDVVANFRSRNPFMNLGEAVEDGGRISHFYAMKKKGLTDLEAVASVNKYLFDYENGLTAFERGTAKRLSFFYTFARFNLPLQLENLFTPSRMYKAIALSKAPGFLPNNTTFARRRALGGEGLPEYLLRPDSFVLPWDPDLSFNAGLPNVDLAIETRSDPGAVGGGFSGFLRSVLSQGAPPLKGTIELAFQKDTFLGRDLATNDRSNFIGGLITNYAPKPIQEMFGAARNAKGGFRIDPFWNHLIKNSPWSRFNSLIEKAMDTRLPDEDRWRVALTSFAAGNTTNMNVARKREYANRARRALAQLRSEGRVKSFTVSTPSFNADDNLVKALNQQAAGRR